MKLDLSRVTAICVHGDALTEEQAAHYRKITDYMREYIDFAAIKLLMIRDPGADGTEFIQIPEIPTYSDFQQFCLSGILEHVQTDFCLVFQADGFVLNPELWKPEFFDYDYIGAPWPPFEPWPEAGRFDRRVGNGGFSLRSKRLLEFTKGLIADRNEDIIIASTKRDEIEAAGLKIAPLELALDFSIETEFVSTQSMQSCFGFHHKARVSDALKIISEKTGKNL